MKTIIYTFLVIFLFTFSVFAQTSAKTEPVLRVEVENGKTLDLTAKDLAKFTRREIKAKAHDEKEAVYVGVNLSEILLAAGAKIGKGELRGKDLPAYLLVEAADGYRVTFAIAEISSDFTDKIILLADTRDGKPLDADNGFWQIIVPDEKKHGRWVRQVIKLSVKKIENKANASIETNSATDEEAILEIIFRKIVEPWRSNSDNGLKAYYVSVDNRDPSDNLLKKLINFKLPVKKASESYIFKEDGSTVLDKNTKERGVLFSISKLDWKSKNEVKVNAGSYTGNMGSDSCDYVLRKENGEWKITSAEENCIVS